MHFRHISEISAFLAGGHNQLFDLALSLGHLDPHGLTAALRIEGDVMASVVDFEVLRLVMPDTRAFKAGDIIFNAGDAGGEFFIIKDGSVGIRLGGRNIETLGRGEIFGEMSLVDAKPRSATVVAETDCAVIPISEKQFLLMVREAPYFALSVMRVLAQRLRAANSALPGS